EGIRVNSIHPGLIDTAMSRRVVAPEAWAQLEARRPMKRAGTRRRRSRGRCSSWPRTRRPTSPARSSTSTVDSWRPDRRERPDERTIAKWCLPERGRLLRPGALPEGLALRQGPERRGRPRKRPQEDHPEARRAERMNIPWRHHGTTMTEAEVDG